MRTRVGLTSFFLAVVAQAATPNPMPAPAATPNLPAEGMPNPFAAGVPAPSAAAPNAAAPNSPVPSENGGPTNALQVAPPAAGAVVPAPSMNATSPQDHAVAPPPIVPTHPVNTVDYKKFRDPFKEPVVAEALVNRSDLERFPVTDFKVTGVITGPVRMRAMVLAPDGKTHYVTENMKMGTRDGVIVKITTKTVVVKEKVVNPLGEVEQFDTEISLDQQASGTNTPAQ